MMSANTRRGKSQRLSGRGVLVLCYHTGPAGGPSRNPSAWARGGLEAGTADTASLLLLPNTAAVLCYVVILFHGVPHRLA